MRINPRWIAKLVAFTALAMTAACEGAFQRADSAPTEGFTLEVFARNDEQVYLVRHADGRAAAARVRNGVSESMDAESAVALMSAPQSAMREPEKADVSIRAPGFSLSVAGDDASGDGRARIEVNAGGEQVLIDAAGSNADGRAIVRIAGADEDAARDFINEADDLSQSAKAEMLEALQL